MKKTKPFYLFQKLYEILCFCGTLMIVPFLKDAAAMLMTVLLLPFLLLYFSKENNVKKVAFAIVLSFFSYCTWTVLLTFYFTNYLYGKCIIGEHSTWDFFALLIPIVFTVCTFTWSLKNRVQQPGFEAGYICVMIIALLLFSTIPTPLLCNI